MIIMYNNGLSMIDSEKIYFFDLIKCSNEKYKIFARVRTETIHLSCYDKESVAVKCFRKLKDALVESKEGNRTFFDIDAYR